MVANRAALGNLNLDWSDGEDINRNQPEPDQQPESFDLAAAEPPDSFISCNGEQSLESCTTDHNRNIAAATTFALIVVSPNKTMTDRQNMVVFGAQHASSQVSERLRVVSFDESTDIKDKDHHAGWYDNDNK